MKELRIPHMGSTSPMVDEKLRMSFYFYKARAPASKYTCSPGAENCDPTIVSGLELSSPDYWLCNC